MFSNLDLIEQYAGMLLLPNDIADILEIDRKEFISELNDTDSVVRKAFYKGYLKTEVRIREKAVGIAPDDENENQIVVIDIEEVKLNSEVLNNFKSKLIIQLYA